MNNDSLITALNALNLKMELGRKFEVDMPLTFSFDEIYQSVNIKGFNFDLYLVGVYIIPTKDYFKVFLDNKHFGEFDWDDLFDFIFKLKKALKYYESLELYI